MRKVKCGKIIDEISVVTDKIGMYLFLITCALYLLSYYIIVMLCEFEEAGGFVILAFFLINFLMLGLVIFLMFRKV